MADNSLDYQLSKQAMFILKMFEQGNEELLRDPNHTATVDRVEKYIYELSNREKGLVIIDLATVCDALRQVITIQKVMDIEKGMGNEADGQGDPAGSVDLGRGEKGLVEGGSDVPA